MIEQKLEKKIIDLLDEELKKADITGIMIAGAWQTTATGLVKGLETPDANGIITIKVKPREYITPTIPHATFDTTISFSMRAETDPTGARRLDVADHIVKILYGWQSSFTDFKGALGDIEDLNPCGFTLVGGDVGTDRTASLWTCSYNFTINAVITQK